MFQLLYADKQGRMYEHDKLLAGGRMGGLFAEIPDYATIPLPEGASLVMVPEGVPIGIDERGRFRAESTDRNGRAIYAVGALLPQGFTRTMLPAYSRKDKQPLPLFGYAAVGWKDGVVHVAATKTDENEKWNPVNYCTSELPMLVKDMVAKYPNNRILEQLAKCALDYQCFTAQNIFYKRWEGGIPSSPTCNARCLGCISLQPAECCPSPQSRINFTPTPNEIIEIAVSHLNEAVDGIISFGQGCEGEPALAAKTISEAIVAIRKQTNAGTINMNTNAGFTEGIKQICSAGIDSLRVSTISAREATYTSYYLPRNYQWQDVCTSIRYAREHGVYVSLNLLTFPGLTDMPEEVEAMVDFIKRYNINMVQIRNLNIDPDYLATKIPLGGENMLGVSRLIEILQEEIPQLEIGNYSKPVKE